MRAVWLVLALVVMGLGACSPQPTQPEPVGEIVARWDESRNQPVGDDTLKPGATLLRADKEFSAWVDALPPDMRLDQAAELDAVSLAQNVAVVAVWNRCRETAQVFHDGDGVLRFEIIPPDEHISCVWSPRQVEVWLIPLDGLERDAITLS